MSYVSVRCMGVFAFRLKEPARVRSSFTHGSKGRWSARGGQARSYGSVILDDVERSPLHRCRGLECMPLRYCDSSERVSVPVISFATESPGLRQGS